MRTALTALTGAALASVLLAGCDASPRRNANHQIPPPTTAAASLTVPAGPPPTSIQQLCDSLPWPRPIPQVAGELVDLIPGPLTCWADSVKMIAPDGHDYANSTDDLQKHRSFRIASVSPAPATMVGRNETITVYGTVIDAADVMLLPPAMAPCSWLTADEIAHALEVQTVTPSPIGDKAGEEDPFCSYGFDGGMVTSELFSSSALPVDAGHMFALYTAGKPDESYTDVQGLPGPARCVATKVGSNATPSHDLWVLLDGNRLYWLTAGLHDVPCPTLTALARKALQRIGA